MVFIAAAAVALTLAPYRVRDLCEERQRLTCWRNPRDSNLVIRCHGNNVVKALHDQGIDWPVVFDDDFRIWKAFGVDAWPTQLVFDRHGKLRATFVGEGYDLALERTVRSLIAER